MVAVDEVEEHGSTVLIGKDLLVVVEEDNPPRITSSVYFASSFYLYVVAVSEREEILVEFLHLGQSWPMGYILRGEQFSIDLYGDVVDVLDPDGQGVEFFIGDSNRSLSL